MMKHSQLSEFRFSHNGDFEFSTFQWKLFFLQYLF